LAEVARYRSYGQWWEGQFEFLAVRYDGVMPKRSSKPADPNKAALAILNEGVGEMVNDDEAAAKPALRMKNPGAVAVGRLGGKKGGKARAKTPSPEDR
jgi:hypothetical protein